MSPAEIRAAVEFGRRSGSLQPLKLKSNGFPGSRRTVRVLTPFWRVATMTRLADGGQPRFTGDAIPALCIQKLAWVVASPVGYVDDSSVDWSWARTIVIRPKDPELADVQPTWTLRLKSSQQVNRFKETLGRQFMEDGVVAAFPMEAFQPGYTILLTYWHPAGETRRVLLTESHLRNWR